MRAAIVDCFDVYDRRAKLLQDILQGEGYQVSVLISDLRHIQRCRRETCPQGWEMIPVRTYTWKYSLSRIRSHIQFSREALARVEELGPDLLWVIAPPNSLVKGAAAYKRGHPQVRLIVDLMDLWPESLPVPVLGGTPPGRSWRRLRDGHLADADALVIGEERFRETVQASCPGRRIDTLYLARDLGFRRLSGHPPRDRLAFCCLTDSGGTVDLRTIGGLLRGLGCPAELHVIGREPPTLRGAVGAAGVDIVPHGRIDQAKRRWEIYDRCHFGLNLMEEDAPASSPCMDYLRASLPTINNVPGDIWELIEQHPVGLNYREGAQITVPKLLALQSRREQIQAIYDTYFLERTFALCARDVIRGHAG